MTPTTLATMPQRLRASAIPVMLRTVSEQYPAAISTPLVKMKQNPHLANFIRNALPAPVNQAHVVQIGLPQLFILVIRDSDLLQVTPQQWLAKRKKWRTCEYRQAYMEASIEQGVAWQIKLNRERRGYSQKELARRIASTQSAISRAEDPTYGRYRLETLVKVANAFDCALQIKFVPYSQLAKESDDLSPNALYAKSYSEEISL